MANPNPKTDHLESTRFDKIDPTQAKRTQRMGAEASNKAQKEKRDAVQWLKRIVEEGMCKVKVKDPKTGEIKEEAITYENLPFGVLQQARKGNSRSYEIVMGYLAGKPVEKIEQDTTLKIEGINITFNDTGYTSDKRTEEASESD